MHATKNISIFQALRFNDEAEQEMDALVEEDTQQLNEVSNA